MKMDRYIILGKGKRIEELNQKELAILKQELIDFEEKIANLWDAAKIPYPCHLSGGNEEQLIEIFKKIKKQDYILSAHRGHYHYLLAGGSPEKLKNTILRGDSMHIFDKPLHFMTSSIVAGMPSIAVGLSFALKKKNTNKMVWCFVGDGAEDLGHFYEAVRYVDGHSLPCKFIIEDNNRAVETPKSERYGTSQMAWPSCVDRYLYIAKYPHVGTGKFINFSKNKKSGVGIGSTL